MSILTYDGVIQLLTSASVPRETAQSTLDFLLKMRDLPPGKLPSGILPEIRKNLEGTVVLRGDKSALASVRATLDAAS